MRTVDETAEANIHLRVRAQDRDIIDQAAELTGTSRTQFMLSASLRDARDVILDQTSFFVDGLTFQRILDKLDAPASEAQRTGMKRLHGTKKPWTDGR